MNRRGRCLDDLEVLDYVERCVPEPRGDELRRHLASCRDCLALVVWIAIYSSRERAFAW